MIKIIIGALCIGFYIANLIFLIGNFSLLPFIISTIFWLSIAGVLISKGINGIKKKQMQETKQ